MKKMLNIDTISDNIKNVYDCIYAEKKLILNEYDRKHCVHVCVDMINGFVKFGALSSKEVLAINDDVASFSAECEKAGIPNYALCDSHPQECTEFLTYPEHCVRGTDESELTDELKKSANFKIFPKLSVNGWLEPEFQKDIIDSGYEIFIITGDCTDMCVLQLALSLKSGMNRINCAARVIIPTDLTATCSLPARTAETGELAALLVMQSNGIEIVKNVEFE